MSTKEPLEAAQRNSLMRCIYEYKLKYMKVVPEQLLDLQCMHPVTAQQMTPDTPDAAWQGQIYTDQHEILTATKRKAVCVIASGSISDQATRADLCTTLARASTTCPFSSRSNRTKSACLHCHHVLATEGWTKSQC